MGQSHSTELTPQTQSKRRSFLINSKKLIRLRRQTSHENSASPQSINTQSPVIGENDYHKTADRHEQTTSKTNHDIDIQSLPTYETEPVFNRHKETTHTHKNVEASKHNEIAAFSHESTTKDESLIEENLLQQLRELIEHLLCGGDRIDGDIVLEIDSIEKTLKILPHQSSLVRGEVEEIPPSSSVSSQGNFIIIREHITPSSCDTVFTDAVSSVSQLNNNNYIQQNLSVTKLEQFDIASDIHKKCEIVRNESFNVNGIERDLEDEDMPIKNSKANGQDGSDKGIFNVSRIKKVELSEIPLASDICNNASSSTIPEQQTVTTQKVSSNGSGSKVLQRVISLTTANHNDSNNFTKQTTKPSFIPEKLQFSAYEKFEGQMLMNWFIQSIPASLTTTLNESDLNALTMQYCTNLLIAGIIKSLDTTNNNNSNGIEVFKSNLMYQWTYREQKQTSGPGKIEAGALWPHNNNNNNNNNERKVLNISSSPTKRQIDGESKIPKLVSNFTSTPKPRLQQMPTTQPASLSTPENSLLLNGTEFDQNLKITELKLKLSKCETIQETLMLIRCFLSEYAMQSSESSTNSSIALSKSILNGSDSTIFDKNDEQTLFTIPKKPESIMKTPLSSRTSSLSSRSTKSRTSPSTPTSNRSDTTRRIRRNLSTDSVSTLPNKETNNNVTNVNTGLCKKCMLISPAKTNTVVPSAPIKRFVDKATVMDVEPLSLIQKLPEFKNVEIQTDDLVIIEEKKEVEKEEKAENVEEKKTEISTNIPMPPPLPPPLPPNSSNSSVPPPPPPMPMSSSMPPPIPPAPPLSNVPKPPPGPPAPPNALNQHKGPCPLPPPISMVTPALRKNAVNPPKPMKPLYWTRIVTPIIVQQHQPQDTTDGKTSPDEMMEKDELWKEIDETNLDNLDEFTELFSRQGVVPRVTKETTTMPKKIKAIKILDSKRSQNVGIFVRSIHVDFAEIEHAIYHCDTSVVSQETLQNIMAIRATNEELSMIKEAKASHNGSELPPLDAPENFLLKISEISSSAERISCIVFQDEFEEQCIMVSRKVHVVKSLCEFLLENEHLKEVFSIILTLGNFMNGGNRQRGQADGFGLEILGKLKDVKSKDPKITLLHFIVKTYITHARKSCGLTEIELPIPDPNDVDKSLHIDFGECQQQLNALKNKVEECKKTTEKVIAASAEEHVQPFKDKMEAFLTMATKKIESRLLKVEECKVLFIKTLKFYKYMAKSGTIDETTPAQFFEYWTSFTSDFNMIFKKEIVILTNELLKKSRQQTKPQSKPSQGENNLKARINRLKSRDK
ncbi:protein cappuccino-like isoform X2 [Chironomus tepperi]|uniref:protein cappuccino-like isoform X2 n=1 Tax=Chironomus tepperi TaxID=113505 RepID=UPI00391FAAE3